MTCEVEECSRLWVSKGSPFKPISFWDNVVADPSQNGYCTKFGSFGQCTFQLD
jgi:hypothetical protein